MVARLRPRRPFWNVPSQLRRAHLVQCRSPLAHRKRLSQRNSALTQLTVTAVLAQKCADLSAMNNPLHHGPRSRWWTGARRFSNLSSFWRSNSINCAVLKEMAWFWDLLGFDPIHSQISWPFSVIQYYTLNSIVSFNSLLAFRSKGLCFCFQVLFCCCSKRHFRK